MLAGAILAFLNLILEEFTLARALPAFLNITIQYFYWL